MRKTISIIAAAALTTILLTSCTVTQHIAVDATGGGASDISMETTDFFKALIADLASFDVQISDSESDPDIMVLDRTITSLWSSLEASSSCIDAHFYRTPDKTYIGAIRFSDLEGLVGDLGSMASPEEVASLLTITDKSLNMRICMENYHVLAQIVPFLNEENFQAYGPAYNHGMSEDDYLQMMDFILGDETSAQIMDSSVTLTFKAPGAVKSTNGTKVSSDTVRFTIPLIKVLLLNEDIILSMNWS